MSKWVSKVKEYYNDNYLIHNIKKTEYSKTCLLIYIVRPFRKPNMPITHTNISEVRVIVDVLSEQGYNVDVISFLHKRKIDYSKYDLIFGFGEGYAKAVNEKNDKCKTIFYATTACPLYASPAEYLRIKELKNRKGVLVEERRQEPIGDLSSYVKSIIMSDAIFCLGNEWTISTYEFLNKNIYRTTVSGLCRFSYIENNRKISIAKKSFLWIGGAGNVHKGLDLCIEVFSHLPQFELYIVGTIENDIQKLYEKELEMTNIHSLGFMDTSSIEFKNVCEKCAFTIFPSCSEGCATSVITAMFTGLIPIVTRQTGIDVEDFGFDMNDISINGITTLINDVTKLEDEDIRERQKKVYEYVNKKHTIDIFKKTITKTLETELYK